MLEDNPPWDCMYLDLTSAEDDDIWYDCTHPDGDMCDSCNAHMCKMYDRVD